MGRGKDFAEKHQWWLGPLVGAVIGGLGVFGLAVVGLHYQMSSAVPELKQALKDSVGEIRGEMKAIEERQRADLGAHTTEERASRDRTNASVKALQSHVIALKVRVEGNVKPNDIKDLVSNVQAVTTAEATSLASLTEVSGAPKLHPTFAKLKGAYPNLDQAKMLAMQGNQIRVHDALTLFVFARDGRWEATPMGLKVQYDGGSATFAAKPSATKVELTRQADLLNSLSDAVETVGSGKPAIEPPVKSPATPYPPGASTPQVPETRAPAALDKLR